MSDSESGPETSLLPAGIEALIGSGLALPDTARLYGRSCLDWTERRMHLGGPLGVALTAAMIEAGWLRPLPRSRALQPSADGLHRLGLLGVTLD